MDFIKNGRFPISLQDIYRENPQTSFPVGFDPRELGYEPVAPIAKPDHNPDTETIRRVSPVHDGSRWLEVWEVVALDADTVAAIAAQKEATRVAAIKAQIKALEDGQDRAVREAALGNTTYLQQIEDQIQALRAQL